jgi:hypothetical protein
MQKPRFIRRFADFVRVGYPTDAPEQGHAAVLALCPGAYRTITVDPKARTGR